MSNPLLYFPKGWKLLNSPHYKLGKQLSKKELKKDPSRTEIINYLLSLKKGETNYIEIGVRNPEDNFNHIQATKKYSIDPGVEFKENPVDFQMTSDEFFAQLRSGKVLADEKAFDVIFIDGLHLAEQVDRDIINALDFIKEDGFVVLHDCNPPSEWHARETYDFYSTPAGGYWNGTTWKAFLKWRFNPSVYSCCIDADWGVGILSKKHAIGQSISQTNFFFEYNDLVKNRTEYLNLIDFATLKVALQ